MPTPQQKPTQQAAPDFIPADPDFIPADGGAAPAPPPSTPSMSAKPENALTSGNPIATFRANVDKAETPRTPEERGQHGFFDNALHDVGRGFTETLAHPLAHPVDAITSMAANVPGMIDPTGALSHLLHTPSAIQQMKSLVTPAVEDYKRGGLSEAVPHLAGQVGGMAVGGKVAEPFIKAGGMAMRGAGRGVEAASATPESLKVMGTRALTPGQSSSDLFTRSAKPTSMYGDFAEDIGTVAPKLAEQAPRYGGLKGVGDTLKNIKTQSNDWYQKTIDPFREFPVDASPIADAQMSSIPITDRIEQPGTSRWNSWRGMAEPQGGIAGRTAAKADGFRGELPLGTIDDVRVDTNAKLQNIWNKSGGDRNAALSEPENAREFATNNASRKLAYDNTSRMSAGGRTDGGIPVKDIEANQNLYGAASKLDDVFNKRGVVFARQNPMSLPETLAAGKMSKPFHAAADWLTTHALKQLTDSDALSNAGLDKLINPDRAGLVPRSGVFPKMTATAGKGMQAAGKAAPNLARQPLSSLFFAPTSKR